MNSSWHTEVRGGVWVILSLSVIVSSLSRAIYLRHLTTTFQNVLVVAAWIGVSYLTLLLTHGGQWDSIVYNMPWHLLVNSIPVFLPKLVLSLVSSKAASTSLVASQNETG